jgi:hypothetical protein
MVNDLEKMVLEMIGENTDTPDVFADTVEGMALIRGSLSDAVEEISMVTGCNVRTYYVTLRKDRAFYRLPMKWESMAWFQEVWIVGQRRKVTQKDFGWLVRENPGWLKSSGSPCHYCPVGSSVMAVYPVPAAAGDVLEVRMAVIPTPYTIGEDRIKLRDDYQLAAAHFAIGEFYASRGDAKQAKYHHDIYVSKVINQFLPYPEVAERPWQRQTYGIKEVTH